MDMDVSQVTSKGQLVVPARLRRKYGIKPGTRVRFLERGDEIVFQPVTPEYVRSLCGTLKSRTSATAALLRERRRARRREDTKGGGRRPR